MILWHQKTKMCPAHHSWAKVVSSLLKSNSPPTLRSLSGSAEPAQTQRQQTREDESTMKAKLWSPQQMLQKTWTFLSCFAVAQNTRFNAPALGASLWPFWTLCSSSTSLWYWGPQGLRQLCRWGLTRAGQRGRIPSLPVAQFKGEFGAAGYSSTAASTALLEVQLSPFQFLWVFRHPFSTYNSEHIFS